MQHSALIEACSACVEHARHLVESAKLVQESGRPNIAYHLAVLALEEMGRRELFLIQDAASRSGDIPAWHSKAFGDHTKKLFWCLYGNAHISEIVDQELFFEKQKAAADIHTLRLSGLYVDSTDAGLNVPSEAITAEQTQSLISLCDAIVAVGESARPRDVSLEEVDLQSWLLDAFDNPDLRKRILAKESIDSLKAAKDVAAWTRNLRSEIEASDADLKKLVEEEMKRRPDARDAKSDRWKIRFKIRTASNAIRPKPLKKWNEKVRWIQFHPQQGALAKEELIVEVTLGDNIPLATIHAFATSLSIELVMALNLATSGFWWWPLPPNQQRVYERIFDLEKRLEVSAEDASFRVFSARPALTDGHMDNLAKCLAALPDPNERRALAYHNYLGGLTFIALNCVQWRCEAHAFANFAQSFELLTKEAKFSAENEPVHLAVVRFVKEKFPDLDPEELEKLSENIRVLKEDPHVIPNVRLGDVYFIKLLCETVFRDSLLLSILRDKSTLASTM